MQGCAVSIGKALCLPTSGGLKLSSATRPPVGITVHTLLSRLAGANNGTALNYLATLDVIHCRKLSLTYFRAVPFFLPPHSSWPQDAKGRPPNTNRPSKNWQA